MNAGQNVVNSRWSTLFGVCLYVCGVCMFVMGGDLSLIHSFSTQRKNFSVNGGGNTKKVCYHLKGEQSPGGDV